MIPGTNPFKRTESTDMSHTDAPSSTSELKSPSKIAPPAPIRRASAKKSTTLQTPALSSPLGTNEEQDEQRTITDKLDDADQNELDELERQQESANSSSMIRKSSDSQRSVPPTPMSRTRRSSSNVAVPTMSANVPATVSSLLGAPRINGASTPRPFGEDLPTPNIISRDLSRPLSDQRDALAGGVTSAGLVAPSQVMPRVPLVPAETHNLPLQRPAGKQKRRPSTTGPILCALGCGTMGRSIFSGVLDALDESDTTTKTSSTLRPPARFIACVRSPEAASKLSAEWGELVTVVRGPESNVRAVHDSDYVLLSCKPQMARDILTSSGMQSALRGKVIISILAGMTIETLQTLCPNSKIIRVMPNTPSRIRKGMSVIVSGPGVTDASLDLVSWIFNQVGKTLILDEKHIDAATALCGSGPAFMAVILESMTDGGVMMGIPRAQAEELAAQTMLGTASMVQAGQHPALIRNAVATPGGCTIGGLLEMEDGKIRSTMARTIQTATNIAAGLGK